MDDLSGVRHRCGSVVLADRATTHRLASGCNSRGMDLMRRWMHGMTGWMTGRHFLSEGFAGTRSFVLGSRFSCGIH